VKVRLGEIIYSTTYRVKNSGKKVRTTIENNAPGTVAYVGLPLKVRVIGLAKISQLCKKL
jgi:hypothetical protein